MRSEKKGKQKLTDALAQPWRHGGAVPARPPWRNLGKTSPFTKPAPPYHTITRPGNPIREGDDGVAVAGLPSAGIKVEARWR